MMESIGRIAAIAIIVTVLVTLLKKTSPDMALLVTLAVCGAVFIFFVEFADEILTGLNEGLDQIGISAELFMPLIKTVAIAVITKTGGDICRDAGENAIGNLMETAGAFAAVVLALPLFTAAWELLQELL